ncbi:MULTISPECIES: hypothetical protein [unclassified Ensifer]|uniref:hypothetical protein n=1 Tax=unclassified Ensifer TaxID=2633371 RepID=UPI0030103F21
MLAKVKVAFPGVPDGLVHPRNFEVGDTVEGDLAAVAVAEGWAEAEEGDDNGAGGVALDKMKVDELKAHAASLSIDLGEAKTKAEIIAVIVAAAAASTE